MSSCCLMFPNWLFPSFTIHFWYLHSFTASTRKWPPLFTPCVCVPLAVALSNSNPEWKSSEIHVLPIPSSFVSSPSAPINHPPAPSDFPVSPPSSGFLHPVSKSKSNSPLVAPLQQFTCQPERPSFPCCNHQQVLNTTNDNFLGNRHLNLWKPR